jgi:hypothetical protein
MSKTGTKLAINLEKEQPMANYARLLHDFQWMSYKSRTVTPGWPGLPSTPETVPLFVSPNKSDKDDVKLSDAWDTYLRAINSERGYKFIISPPAGWFNRNKLADSLGFGGNVVEVTGIVKQSAKIKAFNFNNSPPSENTNYLSHPELVHKFTVITSAGKVVNPAEDIDVYTFVIGRSELYVPLVRLELFPKLPMTVSTGLTKAFGLDIREAPTLYNKVIGKLAAMKKATVTAYAPSGSNVWGKIDKGWIPLMLRPQNGPEVYYTTWKMKTSPPPTPRI